MFSLLKCRGALHAKMVYATACTGSCSGKNKRKKSLKNFIWPIYNKKAVSGPFLCILLHFSLFYLNCTLAERVRTKWIYFCNDIQTEKTSRLFF